MPFMHGSSPPNCRRNLKISDQNNWGGGGEDLGKKLNWGGGAKLRGGDLKFYGGPMNPNDAMVVVLKDNLLCLLSFRFIYIVDIS